MLSRVIINELSDRVSHELCKQTSRYAAVIINTAFVCCGICRVCEHR